LLPPVAARILLYLDQIEAHSNRSTRMDFLRIAGNERLLDQWIRYLLRCNLIVEVDDNLHKVYRKTDAGEKIHAVLKIHPYVGTLIRDLGKQRRPSSD